MTPSDYEMIEQGYDPPRTGERSDAVASASAITEPNVEEIVAQLEAHVSLSDHWVGVAKSDLDALIASWRERGEALRDILAIGSLQQCGCADCVASYDVIIAALKEQT